MNQAVGLAVDPKTPLDLSVEPKKDQLVAVEVRLEHEIIKTNLPAYQRQLKGVRETEEKLAYHLACLKAVRVGRGRDGRWESYVEDKLQPLTVRTIDRWIHDEIERGNLPAWVAAKLVGNRKKVSADPAKPRYKMNLTLSFAGIEDKDLIERAKEQLGDEKLTDIILDAVRKELGQ